MTSNFSADVMKQDETEYYHSYKNGSCYESVLSLTTQGFATNDSVVHVNRDEVFSKLKNILATVKVEATPSEQEHSTETAATSIVAGTGNK
jgi:hypothetical protein